MKIQKPLSGKWKQQSNIPKDAHFTLRASANVAINSFALNFSYPLVIYFVNYFKHGKIIELVPDFLSQYAMKECKPKQFVTHSDCSLKANLLPCADGYSQTLSLLHSIDSELLSHLLISILNNISMIYKHTSPKRMRQFFISQFKCYFTYWSFLTFTTRISSLHL